MPDLLSKYLENPLALVGPDYRILHYTGGIYKVIKFKNPRLPGVLHPKKEKPKSDEPTKKPDSSVSRARRNVLELALCNDWKYFCTFTLDKDKYDRFNLEVWKKDFTQWIRDQRKKSKKQNMDLDFKFLFVPELHNDGAWHMHGLLGDIHPLTVPFHCERQQGMNIPDKLVRGCYFDWPEYRNKFGFCSLGLIKNKVATAFYVTKYISKNMQGTCENLGIHSYIPSRGLNRASLHGSVYGGCDYLDSFLTNDYKFLKTGMTQVSDELDFTFGLEYMPQGIEPMEAFSYDYIPESEMFRFEAFYDGVQEVMEGF